MTDKAYVLFETHSDAQRLHKALREAEIPHDVSPTPRHLSSSCGMSLRMKAQVAYRAEETAKRLEIPVKVVTEK